VGIFWRIGTGDFHGGLPARWWWLVVNALALGFHVFVSLPGDKPPTLNVFGGQLFIAIELQFHLNLLET
jgi:hypothetical protein